MLCHYLSKEFEHCVAVVFSLFFDKMIPVHKIILIRPGDTNFDSEKPRPCKLMIPV